MSKRKKASIREFEESMRSFLELLPPVGHLKTGQKLAVGYRVGTEERWLQFCSSHPGFYCSEGDGFMYGLKKHVQGGYYIPQSRLSIVAKIAAEMYKSLIEGP